MYYFVFTINILDTCLKTIIMLNNACSVVTAANKDSIKKNFKLALYVNIIFPNSINELGYKCHSADSSIVDDDGQHCAVK